MAFQDFDLITKRRDEERKQKQRKRIIVAAASTFVLLLVAAAAVVCLISTQQKHCAPEERPKESTSPAPSAVPAVDNELKVLCAVTDHTEVCLETLKNLPDTKNVSSLPTQILKTSISAASEEINAVVKEVSSYKFDTPLKKAALDDCRQLLDDAVQELNRSVYRVQDAGDGDVSSWASAALSYQEACIDGFPEGEEKAKMETALKRAKEVSSNALAFMESVLKVGEGEGRRSVMEEGGAPGWVDEEGRRMLKADSSTLRPNATVAKDGSANFTTISAAFDAMPKTYTGRYVIYVKEGIYEESVVVSKAMVNVTIYGDGYNRTIVTGSKNYADGLPTLQTATFVAIGDGFMAQSIGFRNTAGPEKHQAVALRVQSDRSIFLDCSMEGHENTLYAQTHRQLYRSCNITGTVDFIFGDAAAVFQNCMIYSTRPMESQKNTVTAQGRVDSRQTTGFVIQNSHILADQKLEAEKTKFKTYLGRPWKQHSRTVIMGTQIGDLIEAAGWLEWGGGATLDTLYYAEFNNKGLGAKTGGRVTWKGYKKINKEEAFTFTVGPFLQGHSWLKNAAHDHVPVRFGL